MTESCAQCRFLVSDPAALEGAIPGLRILSSAYGSVRADTSLCEPRGMFVTPDHWCSGFRPKLAQPQES